MGYQIWFLEIILQGGRGVELLIHPTTEANMPITLVVPTSLQMGWIESPPYFCTASETGRDVAKKYVETKIGSLPTHKFQALTESNPEFGALPDEDISKDPFCYMIEVYMDDYILL